MYKKRGLLSHIKCASRGESEKKRTEKEGGDREGPGTLAISRTERSE